MFFKASDTFSRTSFHKSYNAVIPRMLYLQLWQMTSSIIRSIQLKELGNNILHAQFKNFKRLEPYVLNMNL